MGLKQILQVPPFQLERLPAVLTRSACDGEAQLAEYCNHHDW